jgi:type II secretory pathway pseudopilin PulG
MNRTSSAPRALEADRGGFAYIAVVVLIATGLMAAALIAPSVIGGMDRSRVEDAQDRLEKLERAIQAFRVIIGRHPGSLDQLGRRIGELGDANLCGQGYSPGQINDWDLPFIPRLVPSHGALPGSIGEIRGALERDPPGPVGQGAAGTLNIVVDFVHESDAIRLSQAVDGNTSPSAGKVQWTTPADAEGLVTLRWGFGISGC